MRCRRPHVNEGAAANYEGGSMQAAMTDQDDGYMVLDAVEFGEVSIISLSCVN